MLVLGSALAFGCGDVEVELPESGPNGGTGDASVDAGGSDDADAEEESDESGASDGSESGDDGRPGTDDGNSDTDTESGSDGEVDESDCEVPLPEGEQTFEVSGALETFVVPPCVQWLTIEAGGARGGDNIDIGEQGGLGALMRGSFAVQPGEVLSIVVGERGADATTGDLDHGAGGGGGGSFVWRTEIKELLIAAGGGGGSAPLGAGDPHCFGQDGVVTEEATGSRSDDVYGDSPGGADGEDGQAVSGSGGHGWLSVFEDPSGQPACAHGGDGGFGGGGGAGCAPNPCEPDNTAGGGGGYSGGGAGGSCEHLGGGGGGSFNSGDKQDNAPGKVEGDGYVTISW